MENLTNETAGGIGSLNCFPDDKTRKKISEAVEGEKNGFYGKTHSEEVRDFKSYQEQGLKRRKNATSKYVGVCLPTGRRKWNACIRYRGEHINLGNHETEVEAALAYNEAALKYFGPDAKLNIIED